MPFLVHFAIYYSHVVSYFGFDQLELYMVLMCSVLASTNYEILLLYFFFTNLNFGQHMVTNRKLLLWVFIVIHWYKLLKYCTLQVILISKPNGTIS